jgi:predicted nucleic acid-binding protein
MIVVDANVLWEATGLGLQGASADAVLHRDSSWAAPVFWESEVRNICATLMRVKQFPLSEAIKVVEDIRDLLDGKDYFPNGRRVLELAHESGRSAYDCEYVDLAERLAVPLITFDRALVRAFPAVAISPADFLAHSP